MGHKSNKNNEISKVLINKCIETIDSNDVFKRNNLSNSRVYLDACEFLKIESL